MNKIIDDAKKAALSDANVLIQGESGTGKELFAQSIHNYSKRENEPFVAVNCASIPKELMESEFFGYERGAFTGASKEGHVGKFELADGGTLFLDEIGELPLDMQSKLLRVLDNQRISRIGSHEEKKLNIRVIAATNRDLVEEITKKNFREDLYYRLNVMHIKLIPLRERPEDIQLLAQHFIARLNHRQGKDKKFSAGYIQKLKIQNWPGNVRELQNAVERSYFLCEEEYLTEAYLFDNILSNQRDFKSHEKIIPMEEIEAQNIHTALKQCNGSVVKACKILGMSRATIYRKMKRYKIIP
jgi:transcriptional regulator with PAS, ATPase and Fis domain